jgi:hypothetical protein
MVINAIVRYLVSILEEGDRSNDLNCSNLFHVEHVRIGGEKGCALKAVGKAHTRYVSILRPQVCRAKARGATFES